MDRLGDEEIAAGHGQGHQYGEPQAGLQFWRGGFCASQDTQCSYPLDVVDATGVVFRVGAQDVVPVEVTHGTASS